MNSYSTTVGGLLLRVRKTELEWEASIAGPANIMDEDTAKKQAVRFAASVVGKEVESVEWHEEKSKLVLPGRVVG